MDKKKQIFLVVLFIVGLGLCTWSVYHSAMDSNTNETSNNSNSKNLNSSNSGTPIVIDNSNGGNTSASQNSSSNSSGTTSATKNQPEDTYITYTVKDGDSLDSICKEYVENCPAQILAKSIMTVNKLNSKNDLKKGMTIKISERYIKGGFKYTVKRGDSLYSLAEKYMNNEGMEDAIKTILSDNFLSSENIRIGEELFIFSSKATEVNSSTNDANNKKDASIDVSSRLQNDLVSYTIKDDDTLVTIAKKYETTCPLKVSENIILKVNNLNDASQVTKGKTLKLPDKYLSSGEIYTVKSGDTLYEIVAKLMPHTDADKAVATICADNSIEDSSIMAGQKLFIASVN